MREICTNLNKSCTNCIVIIYTEGIIMAISRYVCAVAFRNIIRNSYAPIRPPLPPLFPPRTYTALPICVYINVLYMNTRWRGGFRVFIFYCAPQEITILSTNFSRPLDSNNVVRENSAVIVTAVKSRKW